MIIIGVTGSIGMGKSTVAAQMAQLGAKTLNSDDVVHRLMQPQGKAFAAVAQYFPEAVNAGSIDRKKLGSIVFADAAKLKQLEAILHPLVIKEEEKFAARQKRLGVKLLVLDIPLLFETGGDARMDMTLVATAPAFIQRQRVLRRPNMTAEKLARIIARQMPDAKKRRRADRVITTGLGKAASMRQIKILYHLLWQKQESTLKLS